ncbi:MAG: BspA family leucine-rich repeat surface protein [Erysipelotrichaceae bacterium]|nr:BspA family leucine-rich repeat surface protein [Erysipelotrichaceae bacterium]
MRKLVRILLILATCLSAVITNQAGFVVSTEVLPTDGKRYAVLDGEGNLLFVRSSETYENNTVGTVADIYGNSYTGTIYSEVENTETIPWADKRSSIISVEVAADTVIRPQNMLWWFGNMVNLTSFEAEGFDTEDITNMSHMFYNCRSLTFLDVSHFNTGKVTVTSSMFEGCRSLTTLNVTGLTTAHVYDMIEMFKDCESLKTLIVSSFITSNVISMKGMFNGCKSLNGLDLSGFSTVKVTDMAEMFRDCESLSSLDLSKFNTAKVEDMSEMFRNCRALTALNLGSFNTAKVKDMSSMFTNCSALTSLDLSKFNTAAVTDMSAMFYGCKALSDLNLSSFNTANVTSMDGIFANCRALKTLDIDHFATGKLENMAFAFYGCSALEELYIAGFNTTKVTDMSSRFTGDDSLLEIRLSERFTKWSDDAYLPQGYWKNGRLIKSERELYKNYTSNLPDWAGTWIKTAKNDYIKRAFGANRYKTALAVTDVFMEVTQKEKIVTLIIASGNSFADALAGSYLAAVKEAPIILVNDSNLSSIVPYVRERMDQEGNIYILGGLAAVSEAIEKEFETIANVKRLAGNDRYLTNIEILKEAGMSKDTLLVGTGLNFADSLSASATGLPVLLVKNTLSEQQIAFLNENSIKKIYVLGGNNAVNTTVESQLRKYGDLERLAGSTRFETSVRIAAKLFPDAGVTVLAYSHDFPDGLCGGSLGYQLDAPVILIKAGSESVARNYIKNSNITSAVVMGGMDRLNDALVKKVMGVDDNYVIQYYYR